MCIFGRPPYDVYCTSINTNSCYDRRGFFRHIG